MRPNVLIIPVVGIKKAGITEILEAAKAFMTASGCLKVKIIQDEEGLFPDPFLGSLTLMEEDHPEFALMTTLIKMTRVARLARETADRAEDNTIILAENCGKLF